MPDSLQAAATSLNRVGGASETANRHQDSHQDKWAAQPPDFEALYGLARNRLKNGELDEALLTFRRALALRPRFAEGWRLQSAVLRRLQRWQDALACIDTALSIEPGSAEALSSRAAILAEASRPAESL
ncbi:MAG TPA: tetratricopeptide repeat protein, partial [Micropepsaceae bacterium]